LLCKLNGVWRNAGDEGFSDRYKGRGTRLPYPLCTLRKISG